MATKIVNVGLNQTMTQIAAMTVKVSRTAMVTTLVTDSATISTL